jgi:hypothetical protein
LCKYLDINIAILPCPSPAQEAKDHSMRALNAKRSIGHIPINRLKYFDTRL